MLWVIIECCTEVIGASLLKSCSVLNKWGWLKPFFTYSTPLKLDVIHAEFQLCWNSRVLCAGAVPLMTNDKMSRCVKNQNTVLLSMIIYPGHCIILHLIRVVSLSNCWGVFSIHMKSIEMTIQYKLALGNDFHLLCGISSSLFWSEVHEKEVAQWCSG